MATATVSADTLQGMLATPATNEPRRTKRWWRLSLLGFVVSAAIVVWLTSRPFQPKLLSHAHKIPLRREATTVCWLPNGKILLYQLMGRNLMPVGVYDPRTSALTSKVTQTTRDCCQNAERDADTPIMVNKAAPADKVHWNVWHDYGKFQSVAPPDADFIYAKPPNIADDTPNSPVASPDKQRVAMTFHIHQTSLFDNLLKRLFPKRKQIEEITVGVYVCHADGTQMRLLGTIPFLPPRMKQGYASMPCMMMEHLQWTPDGKNISFLYDDALWTVPVE